MAWTPAPRPDPVRPCQPDLVEIRSDRTYRFPLAPEALWAEIGEVAWYRRWWPWLRSFDGEAVRAGEVWSCVVQPPLPYVVRFDLTLDEVVEPSFVRATASGDIMGQATIEIRAAEGGSELRLRSCLAPRSDLLRLVAVVARPIVERGHDWVLDTGARQFRRAVAP